MKAMTTGLLVTLILAIVAIIILITGPGQKLFAQVKETTDTGIKNIKITPDLLEQKEQEAQTEYTQLLRTGKLNSELTTTFDPAKQGAMKAWAINKLIAEELIKCTANKQKITKTILGQKTQGITCQICARIEITPETQPLLQNPLYRFIRVNPATFTPENILDTKLNTWMHNMPYLQTTYAQQLQQLIIAPKSYEPILTTYPMNYLQLNYEQPIGIVNVVEPDQTTWTQIYPYQQVTTFQTDLVDFKGQKCQTLA